MVALLPWNSLLCLTSPFIASCADSGAEQSSRHGERYSRTVAYEPLLGRNELLASSGRRLCSTFSAIKALPGPQAAPAPSFVLSGQLLDDHVSSMWYSRTGRRSQLRRITVRR